MSLFDLFKHPDPELEARRAAFQERQQQSIRALEAGGLPLDATERLQEQRGRQGTPQHLWTSDLSVNELALTHDCGFEPLGQVLGASTYHVGFQWRSQLWRNSVAQMGATYELDVISYAFYQARHLALSRLWQEAQLLGAHGVVGVRVEQRDAGWADDLIEFSALGTAIRLQDTPPSNGSPWLCNLSGQDFWKLHQAGYEAAGLVAGNCTYFCVPSYASQQVLTGGFLAAGSWRNQEMPEFTQAMFQAREIAQSRLITEVRTLQGTGTVGMTIENDAREEEVELSKGNIRTAMRYNFLALGTAIRVASRPQNLPIHGTLPLKMMRLRNRY
ncbi:hypothetical protein IAD21_02361 [Abditibacteriota bacterium]|nr:hypothetical protein IAD21_02361 [Abditibacteriota bacterium]